MIRIVWYGIAHHELNADAAAQKIELVVKEHMDLEQSDVKGGTQNLILEPKK